MCASATIVLLISLLATAPAAAEEIAVIVNNSRVETLDREEIAQIYLKKRRFWSDGSPILPINRNAAADARAHFDAAVFGSGAGRLRVYWNRAYYDGVLPPATLASDEAIRRFITSEPRAIGYIPRNAVDASVRVVILLSGDD